MNKLFPDIRKRLEKATPGPYRIERVDHDYDEITYEVSSPDKGFHVVFRESVSADEGVCNKLQAELYANSPTDIARLLKAVDLAVEALKEPCCLPCQAVHDEALAEIKKLGSGK